MTAKKTKSSVGRRIFGWSIRIAGALLALLLIWMYVEAGVVRLKSADLPLKDLPSAFEGTTVLYVSDLHINSLNSVDKVNALMDELMRLEPDLLLLGGDYTSFDPLMRLSARRTEALNAYAVETEMRDLFFFNLAQYNPPLGKFGVAGEEDNLLERNASSSLADAMALGGVTLLKDEAVRIYKGNEYLTIVGVDDWRTGMQDTRTPAAQVSAAECALLLCHNPEAIPSLNNQPAEDGAWIDAAFSGHTHGGGVCAFGIPLFNPLGRGERYQSGWRMENGAKVLISNGIGNDLLPLRLNASPEAHLITLTRSTGLFAP